MIQQGMLIWINPDPIGDPLGSEAGDKLKFWKFTPSDLMGIYFFKTYYYHHGAPALPYTTIQGFQPNLRRGEAPYRNGFLNFFLLKN